jgi:hypothetical protein
MGSELSHVSPHVVWQLPVDTFTISHLSLLLGSHRIRRAMSR